MCVRACVCESACMHACMCAGCMHLCVCIHQGWVKHSVLVPNFWRQAQVLQLYKNMWPYFHKSGLWQKKSFFKKCNKRHTIGHWPILVFQHSRYAQCSRYLTTKFQHSALLFSWQRSFYAINAILNEVRKITKTLFSQFNVYQKKSSSRIHNFWQERPIKILITPWLSTHFWLHDANNISFFISGTISLVYESTVILTTVLYMLWQIIICSAQDGESTDMTCLAF